MNHKYSKAFKFDIDTRIALVCKNDKYSKKYLYGYIDESGKEVIPLIYNEIAIFDNNAAIAQKNDLYGVIDTKGKAIVTFY